MDCTDLTKEVSRMKKIVFLIMLLSALALLFSCAAPGGGQTPGGGNADTDCKVTVFLSNTSATVKSQNPVTVKPGEAATFEIALSDTAVFRSTSAGSYDYKTGLLTVPNVTKAMRVDFVSEDVGYDTTGEYKLQFEGDTSQGDSISHPDPNAPIQPGTRITAKAGRENAVFVGWSVASTIADGGRILSTEREYSFDLSPDLVQMGRLILYPNYDQTNVYYYNTNGGTVNMSSRNLTVASTYETSLRDALLRVAISETEMKQLGCASLFYDDGTFTRDGYVLLEYNTKADGTGEGYSLGSKFPMNTASNVLYCIWAKVEEDEKFLYKDFTYARPSDLSASYTPGWNESGVQITRYLGNAQQTVVIPETLGGKPVISIASNAFLNCSAVKTLVLSKNLLMVEDGAFKNFSALKTIYCSDGIYDIGNAVIDASGYATLKTFILNATTPPRFSRSDGAFAKKFCRVLANADQPRIIMIAGSSSRQGFSTPYLQKMLDGEYVVVNFGTTRTTQGFMYLEAMQNYANERDIILYAPENSSYMMGEGTLYWKTFRDMEGMYNIFRGVDISGYSNVFGALAEYNSGYAEIPGVDKCYAPRFKYAPGTYEDILQAKADDEYGDYQHKNRNSYRSYSSAAYQDTYVITVNNRFKSMYDTAWDNHIANYWKTDDWKNPNNNAWCNINDAYFVNNMNRAIDAAKSTGAKVYFSFCPMDASRLCEEAYINIDSWCASYEKMILRTYTFDGVLGNVKDYFMNHEYFYDNAFHPNDFGRTFRTYQVYKDLAALLGKSAVHTMDYIKDGEIAGCRVETDYDGVPTFPAFSAK